MFTNFVPWRKMKPLEFGLADGAYSGRPHVVVLARKPPNKEFGRTPSTYNDTHAFFRSRVEQLYAIFSTFAIVRAPWRGHGEAGMEKLFGRMKVLINLVAFYLRRFQKYELVGPWRHNPGIKEKARASKPAASTSNVRSSSSSSSSSTSSSSAPQNNNVEHEVVASDGEVSVDSDYTSDPVEANKVRVDRQKAKVPCLQPLVLTRRQQAIANATI